MRRTVALGLAALALTAACGEGAKSTSSLTSDFAAVMRSTAAKTAEAGSSKIALDVETTVQGQKVTFAGVGAFAYAEQEGELAFTIGGIGGAPATTIKQLIVGGALYLELPGQPGYYKVDLKDVVGTSLASSTDPTASLKALVGVSGDVKRIGTVQVRGEKTTHYRGTIDLEKALEQLDGFAKDVAQSTFSDSGVTTLPFDAYIDDDGRLRKMVQEISLTVKGQEAEVRTTIELYEFGTKVNVKAPPASQVKDGAPLLEAFKNASG